MKVAHCLTLLRVAMIPLILLLYLHPDALGIAAKNTGPFLLALLTLSELSDIADGYFARKLDQVTDLGKLLDPLADSLSRLAMFFMLTQGIISIPLEWPILMFSRELVVSGLRTTCALRGLTLAARLSGKIKAIFQGMTFFFIFIGLTLCQRDYLDLHFVRSLAAVLAAANALYSIASGFDYCWANWSYVRRLL